MERLTERMGDWIQIKGCTSLYSREERKGAPASNAIVRLAAHEDTGLTPEEITEKLGQPNNPLTLEELREMDGEIIDIETIPQKGIGMVDNGKNRIFLLGAEESLSDYGITFLAYRRKPEEGAT